MSQRHQPKIRRIVLPSGRAIEVLRFGRPEPATPTTPDRDLHVCPDCKSKLVQPITWSESADGRWALTLECPNCAWQESGVYERAQVELLEDRLDEGLTELIDDLHRLTQANMVSDVDRFIGALGCDMILPEDF